MWPGLLVVAFAVEVTVSITFTIIGVEADTLWWNREVPKFPKGVQLANQHQKNKSTVDNLKRVAHINQGTLVPAGLLILFCLPQIHHDVRVSANEKRREGK